jgi:predicted DNA-binding transcriptional regulator AlpA
MTEKPFLNAQEAAELLGIGLSTLYKYRNKPGFPVIKRGNLFFPRDKLIAWWGSNR